LSHNISAEALNLGPLQDNGGPTETHEPGGGDFGDGGVAIDWIPPAMWVGSRCSRKPGRLLCVTYWDLLVDEMKRLDHLLSKEHLLARGMYLVICE
jgi:hypothetical protein